MEFESEFCCGDSFVDDASEASDLDDTPTGLLTNDLVVPESILEWY